VTAPRHRRLRRFLAETLFTAGLLAAVGTLGWLSTQYHREWDWTRGDRNTFSESTRRLLALVEGPLELVVTARADQEALRKAARGWRERLERERGAPVGLRFLDPDQEPEAARRLGMNRLAQAVLIAGGRAQRLGGFDEPSLARTLERLARGGERWVVFLEGHGERSPRAEDDQGLARWVAALEQAGFTAYPLNLARTPVLPDNTDVLVLASPRRPLAPGEVLKLQAYVARGGNLLWLQDPGSDPVEALAALLGVRRVPGVVVDANLELRKVLGIRNAAVVPVVDYPKHPVTRELDALTLFPLATGLEGDPTEEDAWERVEILRTLPRAWAETGGLEGGSVQFNTAEGDTAGPLVLGLALARPRPGGTGEQRVAIVGDSDFLTNAYLGAAANLDLAMALTNWLAQDDALIDVAPRPAPDVKLVFTEREILWISLWVLAGLPGGLLLAGLWVGWRRRRA
jgi:ABC-type uncharacterized transport system involved in gliding motility auxiliary subunit